MAGHAYICRIEDLARLIGEMKRRTEGTKATFGSNDQVGEKLTKYPRIKWFYYCDQQKGNTIRLYDSEFRKECKGSYLEPDDYVILRGKNLGAPDGDLKQGIRDLFERCDKAPREINTNHPDACLRYFEDPERNDDGPLKKDLQNHIEALRAYAEQAVIKKVDDDAREQKEKLLNEIKWSIHRFEKKGLPVPECLGADKVKLEADIKQLTGGNEMGQVYQDLLSIVVRLGRTCQRPLRKDLREALTVDDGNTTPPRVFRDLIVQFLGESGGSASLTDVMKRIEQSLQEDFTASDLDQTPGRQWCRWKDAVRLEIRKMRKERILTRGGGSILTLVSYPPR